MDPALQEVVDAKAIADVQVLYTRLIDQHEFDQLDRVFTPDCTADYQGIPQLEGVEAISKIVASAVGRLDSSQHLCANHWADIDGDTAKAGCYLQAQHFMAGKADGELYMVAGTYTDDFVRTPEGWRISHRQLRQSWLDGNPRILGGI
ncbi:MAG: nuclear transport factor 2 family protein [Microthrixaceae bacterium]